MRYCIFQLPIVDDRCFRPYKEDLKVDMTHYVPVYAGEIEDQEDLEACETIYAKFNYSRPEHYAARSISISDVISLSNSDCDRPRLYFCDMVGFKKVDMN